MIWRSLSRSTALATVASLASGKIYFQETFDDKWQERWVHSKEADLDRRGYFEVDVGANFTRDYQADRGLYTLPVVFQGMREDGPPLDKLYAASAHFEPFTNRGKTLIIQFQVKVDDTMNGCYGPAIMLGPPMEEPERFDLDTPYYIRFGPDYCTTISSQSLRKLTAVEFVIDDKPIPKRNEMKFYQSAWGPSGKLANGRTNLYRLTIKPGNIVRVDVDMKKRYKGPMHVGWDMMEEPRYIRDVKDVKPKNWGEEWYERGTKPAYWVDEEMIPVPGVTQPDDWDEDEDGEWGPPMTKNPAYKGEWVPASYKNPAWKGEWQPRLIDNPAYEKDNELYIFDDIAWVGFKWEDRKGGVLVDNIIVTDKKKEADEMAEKWKTLKKFEDKLLWKELLPEEDHDLDIFSEVDEEL